MDLPIRQPWRLSARGRRAFDAALAVVLLLPAPLMVVTGIVPTALGVAQVVPLFWRRHHPGATFAAVATASALQALLIDVPLWSQPAFAVATYSVARFAGSAWGLVALAVGIAGAVVATLDWVPQWYDGGGDLTFGAFAWYVAFISAAVITAWALGTLGRTRSAYVEALLDHNAQLGREAAQRAALAAADERTRIAREMHDVVAHGLSVIVVQADGARYAVEHDPQVAARTLATISATAREALTEMRRTLGLLRTADAETAPQPRLSDLPALIEEARDTGMSVHASLPDGDTSLADGVALTVYRVVQEALSNVRRHAGPGSTARVSVDVGAGPDVTVEVCDDGRGASAADDGHGLGLVGMRERVAAHGGEVETGPLTGGGWRVWARIPR